MKLVYSKAEEEQKSIAASVAYPQVDPFLELCSQGNGRIELLRWSTKHTCPDL